MGTLQPTYDIKKLEGHNVCKENNAGQGEYKGMEACLLALNQKNKEHKFLPGATGPPDTWPKKILPGATGPPDTWPYNYHKPDNKMSCCEIVAIVAGSLVLLLLLVSLVSNVTGGANKSRRTARRTARKGTKRK